MFILVYVNCLVQVFVLVGYYVYCFGEQNINGLISEIVYCED